MLEISFENPKRFLQKWFNNLKKKLGKRWQIKIVSTLFSKPYFFLKRSCFGRIDIVLAKFTDYSCFGRIDFCLKLSIHSLFGRIDFCSKLSNYSCFGRIDFCVRLNNYSCFGRIDIFNMILKEFVSKMFYFHVKFL